ncbi:MAG: hypothetical protein U1F43_33380 [Myxococcota bacterium]
MLRFHTTLALATTLGACLGDSNGTSGDVATSGALDVDATAQAGADTGVADDGAVVGADVGSDASDGGDSAVAPVDTTVVEEVAPELEHFSFFVTSLKALQALSGSEAGFGGDLRFGQTGKGAGLRGADLICATIAEGSMPGAGKKTWRAFLSAVEGEDGQQVDAIDRIGEGPWYDRRGRVFAETKADLLADRPTSADAAIKNDFPNEDGVGNHRPDPNQPAVDNHDTLTGSDDQGRLYSATATCESWTSKSGDVGKPRVGHSWPRSGPGGGGGPGGPGGGGFGNPANWMSSLDESGCAPGVSLIETGPPDPDSDTVGSGGGYGGFYCFALEP